MEKTHTRQQAEERLAAAMQQKTEIERNLAASMAQRKQLESAAAEVSAKRAADSAEFSDLRKARYRQAFTRAMRSTPLLIAAFVLGIVVSTIAGNSLSPERATAQGSAQRGTGIRALTMDKDLSAFSARLSANPNKVRRAQ